MRPEPYGAGRRQFVVELHPHENEDPRVRGDDVLQDRLIAVLTQGLHLAHPVLYRAVRVRVRRIQSWHAART